MHIACPVPGISNIVDDDTYMENVIIKSVFFFFIFTLGFYPGREAFSDEPSSGKEKAERLFKEYNVLSEKGDFEKAERKLEECIALQPDQADYRREFAFFIIRKAELYPRRTDFRKWFSVLLEVDDTEARYPDYGKALYSKMPLGFMISNHKDVNIVITRNILSVTGNVELQ